MPKKLQPRLIDRKESSGTELNFVWILVLIEAFGALCQDGKEATFQCRSWESWLHPGISRNTIDVLLPQFRNNVARFTNGLVAAISRSPVISRAKQPICEPITRGNPVMVSMGSEARMPRSISCSCGQQYGRKVIQFSRCREDVL